MIIVGDGSHSSQMNFAQPQQIVLAPQNHPGISLSDAVFWAEQLKKPTVVSYFFSLIRRVLKNQQFSDFSGVGKNKMPKKRFKILERIILSLKNFSGAKTTSQNYPN